jgi:uncharacterized protein (DUF362 family)
MPESSHSGEHDERQPVAPWPAGRLGRRDFVRAAGGIGVGLLLAGCQVAGAGTPGQIASGESPGASPATATAFPKPSPTGTGNPSPTPPPSEIGRVALVMTEDRSQGLLQAVSLFGGPAFDGQRVMIKPNFNSADPPPGSTDISMLGTLVDWLRGQGAASVQVGDRSGMGQTHAVMEGLGLFELAGGHDFEVLVFDDLPASEWVTVKRQDFHWRRGFRIARPCLQADALISVCCLKTHRFGGHFTMALKNSVGMVAKLVADEGYNYMTELHNSANQRRMIAEINSAYKPKLVVLDGLEAFIAGGPDQGIRVHPGVMLAGSDRVAIDSVGVALLRLFGCTTEAARGPIFGQDQIARAVELGLGAKEPQAIQLMTDSPQAASLAERLQGLLAQG